ncbi:MAG: hypothetical protein KKH94_05625 [Candidatus Omnitrophica bacterium]|nr:hypothetical protein [Candidatus Omnitrophota bacterium]
MMSIKRNAAIFIFVCTIVFHVLNNILWLCQDGMLVHGCHSVWHEKLSHEQSQFLKNETVTINERIGDVAKRFKISSYGYAFNITNYSITNFLYIFPLASSLNGHIKLWIIHAINFLQFLAVLLVMVWLGTVLYSKSVGIWSAVIMSFYPGMIGLSRKVTNIPITILWVILLIILIMKWKTVRKIPWTLGLSLIFICGVLSGPLFLAFAVPLVCFHGIYVLIHDNNKKKRFVSICFFFIILCLFFHWYVDGQYAPFFTKLGHDFQEAYDKFTFKSDSFIGSAKEGVIESFLFAPQDAVCPCTQTTNVGCNLKTFLFYLMECIKYISIPFCILAFFSFFLLLSSRTINRYKKIIMSMWLVGGYLLLSVYHIKWGKFCAPLLPVFALSSAYFIEQPGKLRTLKKSIVVIMGVAVALYYSYIPSPQARYFEKLTEGLVAHRPLSSSYITVAETVAQNIMREEKNNQDPLTITFLDKDSSRFVGEWVTDMSVRVGLLVSTFIPRRHVMNYFWTSEEEMFATLHRSDILLIIAHEDIVDIQSYMFPKSKQSMRKKFELLYRGVLRPDTMVYCVRVINQDRLNHF